MPSQRPTTKNSWLPTAARPKKRVKKAVVMRLSSADLSSL
jgi:hypothetical protein